MSTTIRKHISKSKYQGVSQIRTTAGKLLFWYQKTIKGVKYEGYYETEIECARQYDLCLIKNGLEPVNILKRK